MARKLKNNQDAAFIRRTRAASALAPDRGKPGDERAGDDQPARKRKKSQLPRRTGKR